MTPGRDYKGSGKGGEGDRREGSPWYLAALLHHSKFPPMHRVIDVISHLNQIEIF